MAGWLYPFACKADAISWVIVEGTEADPGGAKVELSGSLPDWAESVAPVTEAGD